MPSVSIPGKFQKIGPLQKPSYQHYPDLSHHFCSVSLLFPLENQISHFQDPHRNASASWDLDWCWERHRNPNDEEPKRRNRNFYFRKIIIWSSTYYEFFKDIHISFVDTYRPPRRSISYRPSKGTRMDSMSFSTELAWSNSLWVNFIRPWGILTKSLVGAWICKTTLK